MLLPLTAISQRDFESRYLTVDAQALPALEDISNISLYNAPTLYSSKLKTFQMNAQNYRQQVDMMAVLNKQEEFVELTWKYAAPVKEKKFGFSVSVDGNNSWDGYNSSNGIRNMAFQDVRNYYWCAPSPSSSTAGKRN